MSKHRYQNGFSLIEILLALLVVSVGILSITGLLGTALDSSTKAHSDVELVSFSDMIFNYCHSTTNWSGIPISGSINVPGYDSQSANIRIGSLDRFTCKASDSGGGTKGIYTVSYILNASESGNMKTLSLRVWPGYSTNGPSRTFYTEIYNWNRS